MDEWGKGWLGKAGRGARTMNGKLDHHWCVTFFLSVLSLSPESSPAGSQEKEFMRGDCFRLRIK